jgi:hypothetical protein
MAASPTCALKDSRQPSVVNSLRVMVQRIAANAAPMYAAFHLDVTCWPVQGPMLGGCVPSTARMYSLRSKKLEQSTPRRDRICFRSLTFKSHAGM